MGAAGPAAAVCTIRSIFCNPKTPLNIVLGFTKPCTLRWLTELTQNKTASRPTTRATHGPELGFAPCPLPPDGERLGTASTPRPTPSDLIRVLGRHLGPAAASGLPHKTCPGEMAGRLCQGEGQGRPPTGKGMAHWGDGATMHPSFSLLLSSVGDDARGFYGTARRRRSPEHSRNSPGTEACGAGEGARCARDVAGCALRGASAKASGSSCRSRCQEPGGEGGCPHPSRVLRPLQPPHSVDPRGPSRRHWGGPQDRPPRRGLGQPSRSLSCGHHPGQIRSRVWSHCSANSHRLGPTCPEMIPGIEPSSLETSPELRQTMPRADTYRHLPSGNEEEQVW